MLEDIKKWRSKETTEKTWEAFKIHFGRAIRFNHKQQANSTFAKMKLANAAATIRLDEVT